jgi:hypothetical protein
VGQTVRLVVSSCQASERGGSLLAHTAQTAR